MTTIIIRKILINGRNLISKVYIICSAEHTQFMDFFFLSVLYLSCLTPITLSYGSADQKTTCCIGERDEKCGRHKDLSLKGEGARATKTLLLSFFLFSSFFPIWHFLRPPPSTHLLARWIVVYPATLLVHAFYSARISKIITKLSQKYHFYIYSWIAHQLHIGTSLGGRHN